MHIFKVYIGFRKGKLFKGCSSQFMKMDILLESLEKYYKDQKNIQKLLEVVEINNKISLRIIDWFVTNYSKKKNIYYTIYITPEGEKTFQSEGNTVYKQFNTYIIINYIINN